MSCLVVKKEYNKYVNKQKLNKIVDSNNKETYIGEN